MSELAGNMFTKYPRYAIRLVTWAILRISRNFARRVKKLQHVNPRISGVIALPISSRPSQTVIISTIKTKHIKDSLNLHENLKVFFIPKFYQSKWLCSKIQRSKSIYDFAIINNAVPYPASLHRRCLATHGSGVQSFTYLLGSNYFHSTLVMKKTFL